MSTYLRAWLAKQLRRKDVPDEAWDFLVKYHYVEEAEQDEEGWQERIMEVTRDLLRGRRDKVTPSSGRRHGRGEEQTYVPLLTPQEQARAKTLAGYLAHHAAGYRPVRHFRATYLGGTTISPEQADNFLTSPATRFLAKEQFEALGVPLLDHQATLLHEDKRGPFTRTVWAGGRPVQSDPGVTYKHTVRLRLVWPEGSHEEEFGYEWWWLAGPELPVYTRVPWVDAEGHECSVFAWPGTVLHHLGELSAALAKMYLWQPAAATRFVLTGVPPDSRVMTVSGRMEHRGITTLDQEALWPLSVDRTQITITVDAWVSADTVWRTYRAAQKQILKKGNRPLGKRSLALARFLTETEGYSLMKWRQRMAVWNQRYPMWAYERVGSFCTDIMRAERQLCSPVG